MKFNPNKTLVETIKEGAFGGTYFRDNYSGVNIFRHRNSLKELHELKNIYEKFYSSDYYDFNFNKYKVKTASGLWIKNKKICCNFFLLYRRWDMSYYHFNRQ